MGLRWPSEHALLEEIYFHQVLYDLYWSILLVDVQICEKLESGKPSLSLLYVTPELIATPGFMAKLTKIHGRGLLNLIAIDEVWNCKAFNSV